MDIDNTFKKRGGVMQFLNGLDDLGFAIVVMVGILLFIIGGCFLTTYNWWPIFYTFKKTGEETLTFKVKDLSYVPSTSHSGTGVAMGSNGGVGVTSVTTSSSSKYCVVLQNLETKELVIEDSKNLFSSVEVGDVVELLRDVGKKTNRITGAVSDHKIDIKYITP